jgi:hypothetical protein
VSVHWLQPLAWWGLALLALPIVIHLLARHRSQRLAFPSLVFLPAAPMAALRRRVITNWPLLAVRLLMLAAAVAAVASPVFVSEARRRSWDERVARAIVVASPPGDEIRAIAAEEALASYASTEISAVSLPDAIREALRWLGSQGPAAREIVIVGDLREGALAASDLASVAPQIGLRFLPVAELDAPVAAGWRAVAENAAGTLRSHRVLVTPDLERTSVEYTDVSDSLPGAIRIVAAEEDQPYADALLRAVLRDGLVLGTDDTRTVMVAFDGAPLPGLDRLQPPTQTWMRDTLEQNPEVRGGELDGRLVVRPKVPLKDARAAQLVADVLRTAFTESRIALEPRRIPAALLAAWSRPHGASPADVRPADEGDRRWFWGLALILLAVEHVLRRRTRAAA